MRNGFTLIELLIVAIIVTIFSGALLASYNTFTSQTQLKSDARKLADVIELARKKTLAKDVLNSCVSDFGGYQVKLNSSTQYILYFCCAGDCTSTPVNTYDFSTAISISAFTIGGSPQTLPYSIQFAPPLGMTGLGANAEVQLRHSAIAKCLQLTITPNGIVTINDSFTSC